MFKRSAMIAASVLLATASFAETIEVQMLNKGDEGAMVFEPAFVAAQPGDSIVFVSKNKGHNAETIEGMMPDGFEGFKSKLSKDFSVTLDLEGIYGIKCTPHYALGMVMLIQVGVPENLEEAASVTQRGKAKQRFEPLFAQIQD